MRVVLCVLLLGVVTMLPARAVAGPPATADQATLDLARQYVDAGVAAQNAGDYDTAITLFSKAYQLVQHPVLIFDLAQAHRLAGRIDQALTLYRRYLAEDPQGANAKTAREFVTELEARKAERARPAAPKPKADATPAGSAPRTNGPPEPSAPPPAAAPVAEREPEPEAHPTEPVPPAADTPPSRARLWRWSLGISGGVTLAASVFTIYSIQQMNHSSEQVRAIPDDSAHVGVSIGVGDCGRSVPDIENDKQVTVVNASAFTRACTWHQRQIIGLVFTSVGAAAAVASLILMMREPSPTEPSSKSHEIAVAPIAMPGGGGAALSVTW